MKVLREIETETNRYEVGDRIGIVLNVNGKVEEHTATAIRELPDNIMEFILDDCLDEDARYNPRSSTKGGYLGSELRNEILKNIKSETHEMLPNEDGDLFYLLSLREVRGLDEHYDECDGQIEYFKTWKNRIATRKNRPEWYWLRDVVSSTSFASVNDGGDADDSDASNSRGIRPAFRMNL